MTYQFKNNASTTLSGSINNSQTSITLANAANFPVLTAGQEFFLTMYEVSGSTEINIEIVKVTATSGNNLTVVRAQDGTTARSRDGISTCYVELRMTAAAAQEFVQKADNLSDLANAATARTNLGLGSIATQAANNVNITGGTISGVTIAGIDSTTTISDNADTTKKVAFEVSGVATGTTRTLTVPNADGTIALTSNLSSYQPLDSDLTAVAGLAANGLIARTGTGTAAVRTITQPAAGITVTNGDGVSGNPTLALANDLGAVEGITGTGIVRRTAADTWSASALVDGDLPSALTGKTYNGLTLTANATGFSAAGGTTSKSLTVSNTLTLAGTDGTTITLPATSGTVPLNNQTFFIGTTSVAINRASASLSLTGVSIDGSAGSASTATSATTATNLAGGNNTTLLGSIPYQSNTNVSTLLSPNTTTTKQFLRMTGTGTNGAAPAWDTVAKADVGLANVENTAISTWTGSTNITNLGTVGVGTWQGTAVGISYGGTGATSKAGAYNALSPNTTLGDITYHDGTNSVRLAGNTTTNRRFLRQTGTGAASAAPAWDGLVDGDVPTALTGKTYNGLTLTAAATGFTVAGGTTSKTLTVSNTLTLSGTDSSTLNIGAGGTLGSAAFTASTAYAPAAGSASVTTVGTISSGTWQGSAIGISYGGTGAVNKTAGYNALSPNTTLGDLTYHDGTNSVRLAGSTTATKRFLTQTGTGTVSAAPGWNAIVDGDLPSALTGKTYNGLTLTANAVGFTLSGGTTSKSLEVDNNLILAGTDGSTLNIGGGGTLGSAAYTASTAYEPAITTLSVAKGGTGNASIAARSVFVANSANTLTTVTPAAGQSIRVNAGNTAWEAYTPSTGTVTSVGGTGTVSGLTLSGTVTTTGDLTLGGTLSVTASNFASQTANTFLAAPNGTAGTPTFRTIVAADIPTLNQNTTGTASNVTGTVAVANGGTGATTLTGVVIGNGTSAFTTKTNPSGAFVGDTDTQTLTNKTVSGGVYSGTVDQTGSVRGGITAVAALNIDCSLGNYFTKTINANSTFTVSNVPASRAYAFTLELTHTSGTVTWFSGVQWPGGTAPTLTTGKVHLFTFVTDDGGTTWRGASQVNYNS